MIQTTGVLDYELAQIRERIDWIRACDFDFISTESGSSEFTHPSDERMLAWMQYAADYWHSQTGTILYVPLRFRGLGGRVSLWDDSPALV